MPEKKISLVIPVFNEAGRLKILYEKVSAVLNFSDCEIIFVNDGSADDSWLVLKDLAANDPRVRLVDFSRNFGKEAATSAGLHFASGDAVITLDADLEHPPEIIPELVRKWNEGYDMVYTVRTYSKDTPRLKRWCSSLYYFLINTISTIRLEPFATDFRLIDRKMVDVFNTLTERGRFFRGLIDWMGYKKCKVEFTAPLMKRHSNYSLKQLWRLAISGVTSFSLFPLKVAGYLGTLITFGSGIFLFVMLVVRWFFDPIYFTPISFVIMFNILLSGIILMCLGFIALYIGSIHGEVLNRPLYIVREKVHLEK